MDSKDRKVFSRHEWISACRFHDLSEEGIVREITSRLESATKVGSRPLVVFDLDSTLYEVAPRTLAIIQEWIQGTEKIPQKIHKALSQLKLEHVGYSLKDTFHKVGLNLSEKEIETAWSKLSEYWWARFFTNFYLPHDKPYPGAAQFAHRIYDLGAHLIYLTGREEAKMREGTLKNLQRDSFPLHQEKTTLLMKTENGFSDAEHKQHTAREILKRGQVVASFENEPVNVVVLFETFPDALHVFMDTVCSDHPAKPLHGIYKIQGFSASELKKR